ncbi:type II toxin-antitoxin system RelE/ParE family toxin [Agrobacterium sp. lyk4-40-TYG-31]|uniref:type II toxin-antitoxin system RelE family toxin n=1 Tax=Agrobacterium sp. lyk4-40-TYG-31 TaxID=3040276 RepID=UPI00254A6639|nr:type II toxin-antitoxin system RelE/ParE family toxin [Agrobacterium sp. lyk4-40-TYG-31]
MTWKIEYHSDFRTKVANIDPSLRHRIRSFLHEQVAVLDDPRKIGVNLGNYWRYWEGGLRFICDIQDQKRSILVIEIGHLPKKSIAEP